MTNLFLKALGKKYRFDTVKGSLNMEQLFELNETQLDDVYRHYENQVDKTKGLLGRKGNTESKEKLEIVEAVFSYKRELAEDAATKANNSELRSKLLEIAESRKFEEMTEGKSAEDIIKMAKKL